MKWTVETLNAIVDQEVAALPIDMRARLSRIAALIATVGLENVHEPHIKHIEGQLWELRIKGKDGISRAIYVTAKPKRLVIVRVFIKKTEKTPRREIEIALQRALEIQK
ncbi:MAG: type II toxin-antitoxin system RelE/ParE family toxin [Methylococcales bacterium]|nr:type II toxin-antitoxin system RelE/ParE family toxin [Methylococcales bacterium]